MNVLSNGVLLLFLFICGIIDIRTRSVFDHMIIAGILAGLPFLFLNPEQTPLTGLLGAVLGGGSFFLLSFISKGGIGTGDAKVVGVCGLFLGLEKVIGVMFAATGLCGVAGLVLLILDRNNRKKEIPFVPFLFAAALLAVLI